MRNRGILILVVFLFGLCMNLYGARYYVKPGGGGDQTGLSWDDAFSIITQAASIVITGDEVWVAAGTFQEGVVIRIGSGVSYYGGFAGTEMSLDQRDWNTNPTIIDGNNSYQCVNNDGIIDGFHITKGYSDKDGGGIYNLGIVIHCSVYNNKTDYFGGGIYSRYGTVKDSKVYNNKGNGGGGISNSLGSSTNNCIIYGNQVTGKGGGIQNYGTINHCIVYENQASSGGGINNLGSMTGCVVFNNVATSSSGGIYNEGGSLSNCVVYNNKANKTGGIFNNDGIIINCTVYGNQATNNVGGIYHDSGWVTNSISWKNMGKDIIAVSSGIRYCCYGNPLNENGNISANPLFVNTSGDISTWDFHLKNGSPCIDAGTMEGVPVVDIEGNPRPGADGKVCMGAYESPDEYIPSEPEPPKRFYVKPEGNDSADGTSWGNAFKTLKNAISHTFQDDSTYEIWAAKGNYLEGETIDIPGPVMIYGGFAGIETNLEQRDWLNNFTLIDGNNSYQCVRNYGMIDGFRLTRGNGGGIYNEGMVIHCFIYENNSEYGGGIANYWEE